MVFNLFSLFVLIFYLIFCLQNQSMFTRLEFMSLKNRDFLLRNICLLPNAFTFHICLLVNLCSCKDVVCNLLSNI